MNVTSTKWHDSKWLRLYWISILVVWLLFALQIFLGWIDSFKNPYPATSFLITIMLTGVVVGYRWANLRMAAFHTDIEHLIGDGKKWYAIEFGEIFNWTRCVSLSAFFTLVASIIAIRIHIASWFPQGAMRILGGIPFVLIGTAFGACLWPGYRMSVFVYRLSSRIERLNPFASTSSGIFNIARTFVRFEAVGIGLILLFGAAFLKSPYRLSNRVILWSAITTSLVWTFWFFFTQYQIHKAMVEYKHNKQDWFSESYEKQLSLHVKHPDHKEFERLERLIALKKEIELIPVWPFDTRVLLTSVGLVLTPVMGAVIQRFIGK